MPPRRLIALDAQHKNKPADPWDRGAAFDLDGDGQVERHELEAALATEYFARLRLRLEARDIAVVDGFSGDYPTRNALADELGASLYLAGHLNAGGGTYGLVGVDVRAPRGGTARFLAGSLAAAWPRHLVEVPRVQLVELRPRTRGFSCIGRCRCPALLLEPLFLDGHQALLSPARREETLDAVAAGIEDAIVAAIDDGRL